MGNTDIAQVLKRETEAWNAHDADGVAACYAEDAVLSDVGLPEPLRGREAIRDSVAGYLAAFSDFQAEDVGEPIVSGNRAAQEWKVTGTNDGELMGIPPTGKSVVVSSSIVSRFDGGKWAEDWVLIDTLGMLQQLGVIPAPGQPT